jgi:hydroxymethylpyrimidine pyrophosphatase-like HAD family hydrolase
MGDAEEITIIRQRITEQVSELSTVICSSPYGDGSFWLEIYPPGVSKGQAANMLALSLGLTSDDAVALGNDYNDTDLLSWAGVAYMSIDSPPELKKLYKIMPRAGEGSLEFVLSRYLKNNQNLS